MDELEKTKQDVEGYAFVASMYMTENITIHQRCHGAINAAVRAERKRILEIITEFEDKVPEGAWLYELLRHRIINPRLEKK